MLSLLAMAMVAQAAECRNATTQADLNRCSGLRAHRADTELDAAWRRLTAGAKANEAALLAAQRQWLRFRDAECLAEAAAYAGGSMRPMAHSSCLADLTEERTARLKNLAQDAAR